MSAPHQERHRTERTAGYAGGIGVQKDGILVRQEPGLGVAAAHAITARIGRGGRRAWSPGLCRWLPESTYLSTRRRTPEHADLERERVGTQNRLCRPEPRELVNLRRSRTRSSSRAGRRAIDGP